MKNKAAVKIGILSLGCPRNLVDAQNLLGRLNLKGYEIVDIDKADVGIVNTCAFIEDAKKESIEAILDLVELKREGKLKKIVVSGCLPQRYKYALAKQIPEVDAFVGRISLNHSRKEFSLTPRHYAYLKICEGCVNNCSFCVIPKIKGRFQSLGMDAVLERVRAFDEERVSEVNIIGQDISGYGMDLDGRRQLPQLLRKIIRSSRHIGWIRLLYLYPDKSIDELLEIMRDEPRVAKYIDLPIQHINDRILKSMRRNTSRSDIIKLIERARKVVPGVAIRTSIIVGFPSETDKEFKELLDFIKDIRFERLGAFIYSREEGTAAYGFSGQVPRRVKSERFNAVMSLQQEVSQTVNRKFLGQVIEVLIDEREKDGYVGRSQHDAPEVDGVVYVRSGRSLKPGDFVKVKITDTLEYDLTGELAQ